MKLSNQAVGALMMALQKSLMEQSDIVPVLKEMDFQLDELDDAKSTVVQDLVTNTLRDMGEAATLIVANPPVVKLDVHAGNETELDDLMQYAEALSPEDSS